ncbi:hypothetical protein J2T14_000108 [Paenibacillus harenae]|nr:hypothetical protein [Paenibacillus harenae]
MLLFSLHHLAAILGLMAAATPIILLSRIIQFSKRAGGMVAIVLYLSELDQEVISKKLINDILFKNISDDGKPCDCIFVPASRTGNKFRTPGAVKQYFLGRSSKILFSGGYNGEFFESAPMKKTALERGVPEKDIIAETKSTNTKENVIESLLVLDHYIGLLNINRIMICTAFYHMRRCHLTLQKYAPPWIEYSFHPVLDRTTRPDNWWKYKNGSKRVHNEIKGLIHYVWIIRSNK